MVNKVFGAVGDRMNPPLNVCFKCRLKAIEFCLLMLPKHYNIDENINYFTNIYHIEHLDND